MAIKIFCVYFTYLLRSTPWTDLHENLCEGHLANVINPVKFYLNWVGGFDSVESNFWLPYRKEKSPLTRGLNYRSACDSQS